MGFVGHSAVAFDDPNLSRIRLGNSAKDYAHSIYAALRELDDKNIRVIVVEGISEAGEGAAVMDRLRRAAWKAIENG